ncbi:g4517 [Coccomyxa elongata]
MKLQQLQLSATLNACTLQNVPVRRGSVGLRRRCLTQACASRTHEENALVRLAVACLTNVLDFARLGQSRGPELQRRFSKVEPGDIDGIMRCIREDYTQHAYFVTGDIWEGVYSEDCYFGDPTVSFTGLQKWRQNLQLLVPFLEDPQIELFSLKNLNSSGSQGAAQLQAEWRLSTYLRLPWRPFIDVLGSTEYTLDDASQQVVRHIESWNVSGTEAILQILRPSSGQERMPS